MLAGIALRPHLRRPRGHDSRRPRVSLISRGTIGGWDAQRFRSNVLLDGGDEDALVGSRVRFGEACST